MSEVQRKGLPHLIRLPMLTPLPWAVVVGYVLVFLIFVVATAEIAIAIPIVLLLSKQRHTLDVGAYSELKG